MELIDTFSIGEKIGVGKTVSTIAMLGPLLAMPSGQGLNMTLLAILKVNGASWLLVLEKKNELRKNVSTIDKISLLARQHYIFYNYSLRLITFLTGGPLCRNNSQNRKNRDKICVCHLLDSRFPGIWLMKASIPLLDKFHLWFLNPPFSQVNII